MTEPTGREEKPTLEDVQKALYRMMAIAADLHNALSHGGEHVSIAGCKLCDEITDTVQFLAGLDNPTIRSAKVAAQELVTKIILQRGHQA